MGPTRPISDLTGAQGRARSSGLGLHGSHVEHAKPAPDLLLLAAERLGQSPRSCWYVGDATWDVLAAKAANMPVIGVATGAVSRAALAGAGANAVATLDSLAADLRRRGLTG